MNRFALTSLYRSLTRHKLYAALNIAGLAPGIAVFLVLFLFVRFETSFDRVLPGSDKIWIVDRTMQFGGAPPVDIPSRVEMLPLLQADYPETEGARLAAGDVAVRSGRQAVEERLAMVDPAYFDLFPLPAVAGSPMRTLARPDGAVITERIAEQYLRPGDAIGQTLAVIIGDEQRLLRVGAVIRDLPAAMTHRNDIFIRLQPDNMPGLGQGFGGTVTFLRFPDERAAEARIASLPAFNERHPDPNFVGPSDQIEITERVIPLPSLHLEEPRDRLVVATLGIVGLIALVLAIVNYVNLSTARADLRAREVALRKVVGAPRGALIRQFLGESQAAAGVAGLLGLARAELALPLVNAAGGTELAVTYWGWNGILLPLIAVVLVTGLVAGLYPAFVLSRFQPASVLSSTQSPGLGRRGKSLRSALVVGQFAIAIALMIGTGVLLGQARHLQNSDLGFERDGLVMIPAFADPNLDPAQRDAIRREIAELPGVVGTAVSATIPTGGSFSIRNFRRAETQTEVATLEGIIGPEFFDLYGARLLAGRLFDVERFPADVTPPDPTFEPGTPIRRNSRTLNAVFNRSAVRMLGFESPEVAIGETISVGDDITIIGVIDDLRFGDPREAVEPQLYYLRTDNEFRPVLSVRHSRETQPLIERIELIWRERAGTVPFDGVSVNRALYERFYEADLQRSRLFALGALLAVIIACLGLYGLAAFNTSRRVREIGIRKSLGASSADIVKLLVGQFLRPVVIANLIAWPLAFFAMQKWLAGFADRIALSPVYFIGASLLAIAIAVLTVLGQSLSASRTTPAWALRHD